VFATTEFFYACKGVSFGSEDPDAYFRERIARPDNKLGCLAEIGKKMFSKIILGTLH